jgi:hypothetical protein
MSITSALSYAEDFTNAVDCIISENTKSVYVVSIVNDQIGYDDSGASVVASTTRITIADGYRAYLASEDTPFDGYLNPGMRQLSRSEVKFLSNGQLTTNMFLVGPICFPYTYNSFSGGLDPLAVFQPPIGSNSNLQVYLQIFGTGLPETNNFFAIKDIVLTGKGIQEGISYKLLVEACLVNPLGAAP